MKRPVIILSVLGLVVIGLIGSACIYSIAVYRSVRVPTGAMMNTVLIGDRVLVDRSVGEFRRGDIVMFRYPKDPDVNYLKRIVGLPGETIEIQGARVIIDGNELSERRVVAVEGRAMDAPLGELKTEGSGPYSVYYSSTQVDGAASPEFGGGEFAVQRPYKIPDDAYFMMGDNRDNSEDSRYWGTVKRELIIGKAVGIYSSPQLEKRDPAHAPSLWSMKPLQ